MGKGYGDEIWIGVSYLKLEKVISTINKKAQTKL
jgi:hypothetical protein